MNFNRSTNVALKYQVIFSKGLDGLVDMEDI
jgi:hypothetical protein